MTPMPVMPLLRSRTPLLRAALLLAGALLAASPASGMTWRWSNPSPHGNNIVDMAWNGYLSVQVTELGQIYTGIDFLGWTPQNSGTTNDLQAVTFFGNRIVFTGANGTVGYSDDGVNFTTTTLNTANWLVDVAASSNLVVTVGDNAAIYTSTDGATWQLKPAGQPPGVAGNWLLGVAWGNGVFVATGEGGYIATSGDGVHWTNHSVSSSLGDVTHVAWITTANGFNSFPYTGFWAVTDNGNALYSTNNGATWYSFPVNNSTNILYAVAANDTSALLAGDSEVRLGRTLSLWPEQTGALPGTAPVWSYYTALWDTNSDEFRLSGDNGMMVEGTATNLNYVWQEQYESARDLLWQVTLANGLYVAVGDHARIMTSDSGGEWSIEALPLTNSISSSNTVFLCVGGDTNLLIAAGTGGSLAISPNILISVVLTNLDGTFSTNQVSEQGVVWYSMPAPTASDLAAVCAYSNNYYLAGAGATLLRSANGTNWGAVSVSGAAGTTDLSGLATSTNMIVAVGDQGLIITSPDGTTWTKRASGTTSGLFRVRCLCGMFLALGENGTILKSTNGVSWSSVASGTTEWLNDAVMITNTCYIVGNNGTVLASTNYVNWTNVGCITSRSLYGAATQNGQLIVVGLAGTILRSQVVPNLTSPIFFYYYAQSAGENIFYVAGAPDQRFTLDTSSNLTTWTTGPVLDLIYPDGTLTFITSLGATPPTRQFYRARLVP
jgi:hypothetical protein